MEQIYRAGIVGLGFIGAADQVSGDALGQRVENLDGTHLTALAGNPRVALLCGASRDEGRRRRFVERVARSGSSAYERWREMLEKERPEFVSVATYTPAHPEVTVACAEAGVAVIYCEKPIAPTLAAAERMIESCRASGALLVINHQRRFSPNLRRLRDLVAAGGLGTLTSVTARWAAGRLGNVGTHVFDAVRMLTGQRAVAVSGSLDLSGRPDCRGTEFADPGGWGVVRLEAGCMVLVDAADYSASPMVIELHGTEGSATVRGHRVTLARYGKDAEEWPGPGDGLSSMDRAVAEIVAWLDAREAGASREFSYDPAEAVETLETIVAFHASHRRSGAWVELPLEGADREIVINAG